MLGSANRHANPGPRLDCGMTFRSDRPKGKNHCVMTKTVAPAAAEAP